MIKARFAEGGRATVVGPYTERRAGEDGRNAHQQAVGGCGEQGAANDSLTGVMQCDVFRKQAGRRRLSLEGMRELGYELGG